MDDQLWSRHTTVVGPVREDYINYIVESKTSQRFLGAFNDAKKNCVCLAPMEIVAPLCTVSTTALWPEIIPLHTQLP